MPSDAAQQKRVDADKAIKASRRPRVMGRGKTRTLGLSRQQEATLLALLAQGLTVTAACRTAGCSVAAAKKHRSHDQAFDQQWMEALDTGVYRLEAIAQDRAVAGSDTLLMFLLKARRPEVYRERYQMDFRSSTMSTDDLARARKLGEDGLENDELGRALEVVAAAFADDATAKAAGAPSYAPETTGSQPQA